MRKLALVAVLLMLCLTGAAFAQSATPFCGGLSDADCAILTKAQDSMHTLDSVSFDMNLNITATNVPNMTGPVNASLTANGTVSGLNAVRSGATGATGDSGAAAVNALQNLDADLTLTLNIPPEVAAQLDSSGSMPSSLTLQIRLVDGVGYVNTDTLAALMSSGGGTPEIQGWYGLDLANFVKALLQQNPTMFQNMSSMAGANAGASMQMFQQFSTPDMLAKFVTIKRTDDGSGDTATFETDVDLGKLAADPDVQAMMQQMMQQQMQSQSSTTSPEDMQMGMQASAMMMQNMTITVTQDIGVSDGFVHDVKASVSVDTAAMMAMMPTAEASSSSAASTGPAPVVNVDFTLNYSNFNSAPAITAPENAQVIPYQSLVQMVGSMMGSMSNMMPMVTPEPTVAG